MSETESDTQDDRWLLQLHLRGGQTVERTVVEWGIKKSSITGELTELTWKGRDEDGDRMPFVRLEAVDAITAVAVAES